MGSKGSQQKTEQTSTATSAPNAQAGALYGDILNQLQGYVQQNPNAPVYGGERVAQFTPDQLAAMGTVNQAQGAYQPYMQQAGQFAQQAGSAITPGQINAAMNPYQQQVIDATMAKMGQKNAQQMSALKGTEAQQGAFGGSRAAVTEANLGGQQNMNMAETLAGLNNQNYTQAVAQAQANRAAAGTGAQLQSGLGTQAMQLPMYGAQQQAQQGALQQRLAQQNLDVPYQNFLQQQAWTPQMLQFQAGLGTGVGSQMGGTTTNTGQTTTTPAQPNPWMQAAGLGLSAATMFSDKRAKENIEPVGHLNDGQKIYKYNYKGDPHTQIGLIAQEVERKHPEAVGESNGLKTVNYDLATRNAVHKADGGSVGSDIVGNAVRMARQMREGMAGGGVPGAGVGTGKYMGHSIPAIIPTSQMAMGKGAPSTPGFVSSPEMKNPNADLMKGMGSSLGTLAKAGYDKLNEPTDGSRGVGIGLDTTSTLYSLGGTVSPESAYHGFAHRAYGGFDPTPISEQGGEDPNKAPVMPPEGFTDQPLSIVPAGEFKPYEAPPQADVPMPRPRPESLRVNDLAAAPMPIGADGTAPPTDGIFPRVLRTESNGRQVDENGNPLTSPKGATGIAQIMPTTGPEAAKLAGLPWDEQKFKYDANYNATLGKAYFDHQTKVFGGDPEKGAAAYNAGPGRLRKAMAMAAANGGSYKDYLPAETQNYLGKIFGQQQAGLGLRGDEDGQAMAFNRESSIAGSQGIGAIDALRAQKDGEGAAPLPFTQGDGGERIGPVIDAAAQAIVPKNDDPKKLPQNLSILERVLGKEFDPATRQAIMAAGLRMMTTPGNIGTVLGTAGMQGMATYSEAKQLEQEQAFKERQRQVEERRIAETERHQRTTETESRRFHEQSLRSPKVYTDPDTGDQHAIMSTVNPDGTLNWFDQNLAKGTTSPIAAPTAQSTSTTPTIVPPPNKENIPKPGQGVIQNNQELVKQGNYDYRKDAPFIETGMDVPEPMAIASRSVTTLKTDAEKYVLTGQLPTVRGGASPIAVRDSTYRNAVQNYGNALAATRGLTPTQLAEAHRSAPGMLRFVMGADGRATVSLGTAIRHLDTVKQLADAWAANDTRAINRIRTTLSREFGDSAATNLNAAGSIVGPEIIKAIGVAGAGTKEERETAAAQFSSAVSPKQLLGAVDTVQKLMGGQLEGKKRQAQAAGVSDTMFKNLIGDRPYEILKHAESVPGAAPTKLVPPTQGIVPRISNKEQYDSLEKGDSYIDARDGVRKVKQ